MEKYILFIGVGAILVLLGIINYRGNVSSVHRYNRHRVSPADMPKYAKCIGAGTIAFGGTLIITAVIELILKNPLAELLIPIGFAMGLGLILYGQFKYNKGIF